MAKTLGIVELADSPNARLPGSWPLAARRLGGQSLLEWLVRRVTESTSLDKVLVLVDPRCADFASERLPPGVAVHAHAESDPLARLAAVARGCDCDSVVRIVAGHPFIESALIDRLVNSARHRSQCDYVAYMAPYGRSALFAQLGMIAEWCRASALERADREASEAADRDEPTRFLFTHPDRFQLRLLPLPATFARRDVRMAIVSDEDWEHAQAIFAALGPDRLEWSRITELVDGQPAMRERMAYLNRFTA